MKPCTTTWRRNCAPTLPGAECLPKHPFGFRRSRAHPVRVRFELELTTML